MTPVEEEFFRRAGNIPPPKKGISGSTVLAICLLAIGLVSLFRAIPLKPAPTRTNSFPAQLPVVTHATPSQPESVERPLAVTPDSPKSQPTLAQIPLPPDNLPAAASQEPDTAELSVDAEYDPEALKGQELEKFNAAQRQKGLVLYLGEWMTPDDRQARRSADEEQKKLAIQTKQNQRTQKSESAPNVEYTQNQFSSQYPDPSGFGAISKANGLPRTHFVHGYYRKNGTYVHSYWRSK